MGRNDRETTETTREPPKNPLPNDSRNNRETTEMTGGNDGETTETMREPPKNDQSLNACNFLNNGPIFNPKKFWKALGLLYQMTVETTGKQRK